MVNRWANPATTDGPKLLTNGGFGYTQLGDVNYQRLEAGEPALFRCWDCGREVAIPINRRVHCDCAGRRWSIGTDEDVAWIVHDDV